jgi:hypothetical protein
MCAQQEPAEPHALPPTAFSHPVHAVVPVTGADERQAVLAGELEALVEAAGANARKERRSLVREHRLEERIVLAGAEGRPVQERHDLVQDGGVAGGGDIGRGGEGEPDAVVRDPRRTPWPNAAAPMLDVALANCRPAARRRWRRVSSGQAKASAMPSWSWSRKP